jgi:hypothetical protein
MKLYFAYAILAIAAFGLLTLLAYTGYGMAGEKWWGAPALLIGFALTLGALLWSIHIVGG